MIVGIGTLFVVVAPPPNARVERAPTPVVFVVIESIILVVVVVVVLPRTYGSGVTLCEVVTVRRTRNHVVVLRGVQRRRAMAHQSLPPDDETRRVEFRIGASRLR